MAEETPEPPAFTRLPTPASAVVVGSTGGLGSAFHAHLSASGRFERVYGLGRRTDPPLDLGDEASLEAAVAALDPAVPVRLVIDATGYLHGETGGPEKTYRRLDPDQLAHAFAVNAIGPALLMKHFLPRFPRSGRAVFATLSAKVGSIEDNWLGGWYGYRASKAALNQLVRTAAIELARQRPEALCVALHPGTVDTALSAPFRKTGLTVQPPATAAARLLDVLDRLTPADTGGFYNYAGERLPW